ncbi:MAG TPA: hypothetical protein VK530_11540 [Candidatus Acidoferrum sp.]|nr:hypothetical protein [Candidatus Acidoferrum sp.]
MSESRPTVEEISAWKAQQEKNREARLRQLYTPGELWKRQQDALGSLMRLRPDVKRKKPTSSGA